MATGGWKSRNRLSPSLQRECRHPTLGLRNCERMYLSSKSPVCDTWLQQPEETHTVTTGPLRKFRMQTYLIHEHGASRKQGFPGYLMTECPGPWSGRAGGDRAPVNTGQPSWVPSKAWKSRPKAHPGRHVIQAAKSELYSNKQHRRFLRKAARS